MARSAALALAGHGWPVVPGTYHAGGVWPGHQQHAGCARLMTAGRGSGRCGWTRLPAGGRASPTACWWLADTGWTASRCRHCGEPPDAQTTARGRAVSAGYAHRGGHRGAVRAHPRHRRSAVVARLGESALGWVVGGSAAHWPRPCRRLPVGGELRTRAPRLAAARTSTGVRGHHRDRPSGMPGTIRTQPWPTPRWRG